MIPTRGPLAVRLCCATGMCIGGRRRQDDGPVHRRGQSADRLGHQAVEHGRAEHRGPPVPALSHLRPAALTTRALFAATMERGE